MIQLIVIGFAAGFLSSLLGIGGGIVLIPSLMFLGFRFDKAVGTSLATIAPASLIGILLHTLLMHRSAMLTAVVLIFIGAFVGTNYGVIFLKRLDPKLVKGIFILLLLLIGFKLVGLITLPQAAGGSAHIIPLLLLGLIAGAVYAAFGIGAGLLIVPSLNIFFGLSIDQVVVTSLAIVFLTSCTSAYFHFKAHTIDTRALKVLAPASMGGVLFSIFLSPSASVLTLALGILVVSYSAYLGISSLSRTLKTLRPASH